MARHSIIKTDTISAKDPRRENKYQRNKRKDERLSGCREQDYSRQLLQTREDAEMVYSVEG